MPGPLTDRLHRVSCIAAVMMWLAWGYPVLRALVTAAPIRDAAVPLAWLAPFLLFGAAMVAAMAERRPPLLWPLLGVQVAAVVAMVVLVPWAGIAHFLVLVAWQVALATRVEQALGWAVGQTLAVVVALAQALNPDLCWVIAKAFALQLLLVFTAQALRREAATARALVDANRELRTAQARVAAAARDAERLRISRDLHDAWGHELTALGLQLEIASHVVAPGKAQPHVAQARELARSLLAKVRDVVATLRDAERGDVREALEALARAVPAPAVHVEVGTDVTVDAAQAQAIVRCAQEAVTNAVRHSAADNVWLRLSTADRGVRLVASNDGRPRAPADGAGHGLVGMRERIEDLGGRLAVRREPGAGYTIDAWLPSGPRHAA